ncbi:Asp-tRNA(Asn)/Glu-tRNA(Gln) amidotransferase subunit GatC [Bdellovibrio svalbardensis]|uniref:Aspartyl/glutamyl-tRNA(Asn/Gln) amidotransferase subunit C n=1 Tax=Bdellovibrio svalbardensis TaxID=2972972 RepID=A0ABT6DDE6_9BACT|nr:Asp-tRNA(Asn)/Glu-tRNA(Gln) amidotransferase subunit GatC [Bdellovibrio svalbardensis]MDG0814867.1 Asp-tRNA(Asn)/Glu-tRNA(Gln) amidotransferase subunit GatC [Bdellovibrio svalbardensis]
MIDKKTIEHIAKLARLHITEAEAAQYSAQLEKVLHNFEQIAKVDTAGVEPLITPTEIEAYWRDDEAKKDFTAEEMTANAPSRTGNLFKVPPVV